MTFSAEGLPLRLLALCECINSYTFADGVTDYYTDGGGIRGLSELLLIKGVMHRLMVEENKKRTMGGQPPLIHLPKPCDYFDLIGGTSTGGCTTFFFQAPIRSCCTDTG